MEFAMSDSITDAHPVFLTARRAALGQPVPTHPKPEISGESSLLELVMSATALSERHATQRQAEAAVRLQARNPFD